MWPRQPSQPPMIEPTNRSRSTATSTEAGGVLDHLVDLLGGVGGARARGGVVPEVQQRGALVRTAGSDDDRHQTRKRGSSTSRSQSPTRLMPSAVKASAAPGKAASHHAT